MVLTDEYDVVPYPTSLRKLVDHGRLLMYVGRLADAAGVDAPDDGPQPGQLHPVQHLQHGLEDVHVVSVQIVPADRVDPRKVAATPLGCSCAVD